MMKTIKMGLEALSLHRDKIESFILRLLLSIIPHTGRLETPSALMGRQIRVHLTMPYSTNEKIWYKIDKEYNQRKNQVYNAEL